MKLPFHILIGLLLLSGLSVAEPLITCTPQSLRGVPGEPLQLEVTVETDRVVPIKLQIPGNNLLHLHSVEKIPIQRTEAGRYVQKRIIIWQGIEAGTTTLTNLTVRFQGLEKTDLDFPTLGTCDAKGVKNQQAATQLLPSIGIVIDAVEPAEPPALTEAKE